MLKPKERKCNNCGKKKAPESGRVQGLKFFCDMDCMIEYTTKNRKQLAKKGRKIRRKENRERKKALMTRSDWYSKLEKLVNQYVKHRDRNEPCCTCGTTNPNIKYDAGHFFTKKARPDIRFELTNIHKQCSVNCNQHGSGMRAEYEDFIINKYGKDHLMWLKRKKPHLKDQFPTIANIEAEINKYRKMLRDEGLRPAV